jgi:hypothetical protein
MTSMRDFAGQSLNWVQNRTVWELITSDNSIIATFPLETEREPFLKAPMYFGGIRYKKAKAVIPDGTGALFLRQEEKGGSIDIYEAEQGSRLAVYEFRPDVIGVGFLKFPDGRRLQWGRVDAFSALIDLKRHHVWRRGNGGWMDDKSNASYVEIFNGTLGMHQVNISPTAVKMRDPELSLLLVLGLYNIDFENTQQAFEARQWP